MSSGEAILTTAAIERLCWPPISMKAEWNTSRHPGDPDWSSFDILSAEDSKIATIFVAAIDHRNHPTIAFQCGRRTRDKDRLSGRIAFDEWIGHPFAGLDVNMGDTIKGVIFPPAGTAREPPMPVAQARKTLIKTRKLTGKSSRGSSLMELDAESRSSVQRSGRCRYQHFYGMDARIRMHHESISNIVAASVRRMGRRVTSHIFGLAQKLLPVVDEIVAG
jgi:hypothetical protein